MALVLIGGGLTVAAGLAEVLFASWLNNRRQRQLASSHQHVGLHTQDRSTIYIPTVDEVRRYARRFPGGLEREVSRITPGWSGNERWVSTRIGLILMVVGAVPLLFGIAVSVLDAVLS